MKMFMIKTLSVRVNMWYTLACFADVIILSVMIYCLYLQQNFQVLWLVKVCMSACLAPKSGHSLPKQNPIVFTSLQ
jgi:hypothetical protein